MPDSENKMPGDIPTGSASDNNEAGSQSAADFAAGDEPSVEETLAIDAELQRFRQQVDDAEQRGARAQAELENSRKRLRREMDEERRYAAVPMCRDLLPVMDNLQRAIAAAGQAADSQQLLEGVKLVASQLENVLAQHQCRMIPAEGTEFDPDKHEAIAQEPTDSVPPGTVTKVAVVGYQLHDRVVRPAQVIVSTAPPQSGQ